jgi:hypothetical protein
MAVRVICETLVGKTCGVIEGDPGSSLKEARYEWTMVADQNILVTPLPERTEIFSLCLHHVGASVEESIVTAWHAGPSPERLIDALSTV